MDIQTRIFPWLRCLGVLRATSFLRHREQVTDYVNVRSVYLEIYPYL